MENNFNKTEESSVFETFEKPSIYSKKSINGFSLFFTPIFGGVLLMQNLKDIDKKKESYIVLGFSIVYSIVTITILNLLPNQNFSFTYIVNMIGATALTEYFYKKYFPVDKDYPKKKVWKALIISILITLPFVVAAVYASSH